MKQFLMFLVKTFKSLAFAKNATISYNPFVKMNTYKTRAESNDAARPFASFLFVEGGQQPSINNQQPGELNPQSKPKGETGKVIDIASRIGSKPENRIPKLVTDNSKWRGANDDLALCNTRKHTYHTPEIAIVPSALDNYFLIAIKKIRKILMIPE